MIVAEGMLGEQVWGHTLQRPKMDKAQQLMQTRQMKDDLRHWRQPNTVLSPGVVAVLPAQNTGDVVQALGGWSLRRGEARVVRVWEQWERS